MAKALLSDVTASIESNLDGASGALVEEGRRLEDLYNEISGLRPQTIEGIEVTRAMTINELFFGGVLTGACREASRVSGAFAALISMATGYIGTMLDTVILEHADELGNLIEGLSNLIVTVDGFLDVDAEAGTTVTGVDDVDYIFDPITGWKESPFAAPGEGTIFTIRPLNPLADHILGINAASHGVRKMGDFLKDEPNQKRAVKEKNEIKEMEKMMIKDPAKTLADFWVNAITQTEGWRALIARGGRSA